MVRNYVRKTDKGSYSKEKFREAVRAIQNGQLSGYKASQLYKIPRMTLMDHVNNKRFKSNTLGRSTALPLDIEEKLASCLHLMEKNGFGLSKQEVLEMVGDYVRLNGLETPFKDDVPGEAWFYGFKNRHNLSVKFDATEKENISDNASMEPERIGSECIEHKLPKVGDWLLVKFATKKTIKHYLGVVTEINSNRNPVVQYLRTASRRNNKRVFSYPHVDDISELRNLEDIVIFLPEPIKERRGLIHFENTSFDKHNIQ